MARADRERDEERQDSGKPRELVRAHGGDIRVQSSPGVGSTFTVVVPLAT